MEHELRAIALGFEWSERNGIDLDERIGTMTLFTSEELLSLRDFMRANRGRKSGKPVHPLVRYSRCQYFKEYVTWLAQHVIARIPPGEKYLGAKDKLADFQNQLMKLLKPGNANTPVRRRGLSAADEARLREVIKPGHPDNPFRRKHQARNYALLLCYLELGIRLSEALVLKGQDLVLGGAYPTLTIHRRADDPEDRRRAQPLVKTAGRILPLGEELVAALNDWMLKHRPDPKRYPGAKRVPYLFVTEDGTALTIRAVSFMFSVLQRRVPGLTAKLCGHLLRHTWNDRFSRLADEDGMKSEKEARLREHLMGWKQGSKMAAVYCRRSTEEAASQQSLALQRKSTLGFAR